MPNGVPDWYSRFRELRNRQDSQGNLSHSERAELDQLEIKLTEHASGSAKDLRETQGSSGNSSVGDAIPQILASPGFKKSGLNAANLTSLAEKNPAALQQIADALGIGAAGAAGGGAKPPAPPRPAPASLGDSAPQMGGGQSGNVTAFDRPTPVVVMGPNPLPVKIEGGLPGQSESSGTGKGATDKPQIGLMDRVGELLKVLAQPSAGRNQSGSNLAQYAGRAWEIAGRVERGTPGRLGRQFQKVGGYFRGIGKGKAAGSGAKAGKAAGAGRDASAAGGGTEGLAGAEAAGAAGPVGLAVGGAIVFAAAVVEFGKATYQFARAQESEIRKLAEVGPQQAVGIARLDAERVGRDIKTAGETGDSSTKLTESISRFEEALRPLEAILTNIANGVASDILDVFTKILVIAEPLMQALKNLYEFFSGTDPKNPEKDQPVWDWIKGLDEVEWKKNQPKWPQAAGR